MRTIDVRVGVTVSGVGAPHVLSAALSVIAMELAAGVDPDAHRQLGTDRLQVMVVQLGAQHEVAGARSDRLGLAFDMPVDLAAHDHPPLVVLVVVGIVGRTWRMDDDEGLDVVAQDEDIGIRFVGGLAGDDVVQTGMQFADIQER